MEQARVFKAAFPSLKSPSTPVPLRFFFVLASFLYQETAAPSPPYFPVLHSNVLSFIMSTLLADHWLKPGLADLL